MVWRLSLLRLHLWVTSRQARTSRGSANVGSEVLGVSGAGASNQVGFCPCPACQGAVGSWTGQGLLSFASTVNGESGLFGASLPSGSCNSGKAS